MEAKLNELLVKFSALRDRISERDKLHNEVELLAKQVEQNKSKSSTKRDINSQGEKQYEVEATYEQKKEEFDIKHNSLVRELQQYNENRLDILSALLLDFYSAQKYFAYSYGRSLYELHDQLREADERSGASLPKPSWQMLMTYVTQTEEGRPVQAGEIRQSLIMRMAGEELEANGGQRQPVAARRPAAVSPPPTRTFTKPDAFASPDDVAFNPHVLADPTNQPYLPLSVMMNTRDKRDAAAAAGKTGDAEITPQTAEGAPAVRRGAPPPTLTEPQPMAPAAFTALHSSLASQGGGERAEGMPLQAKGGEGAWASFDSFPASSSAFPPAPSPRAAAAAPSQPFATALPPPPPPKPRPTSSADFDILSMPFTPSQPAQPQPPPPQQPAPPVARNPVAAPPPPASRQPPPPASRVRPAAAAPVPLAVKHIRVDQSVRLPCWWTRWPWQPASSTLSPLSTATRIPRPTSRSTPTTATTAATATHIQQPVDRRAYQQSVGRSHARLPDTAYGTTRSTTTATTTAASTIAARRTVAAW